MTAATKTADRAGGSVRYELLRTAQSLLYDHGADRQHRTCWCMRRSDALGGEVVLYRRDDGRGARLGGVMRCGAIWTCPVCCQRVSKARGDELRDGIAHWRAEGRGAYLVTLTFPHGADDNLPDLLDRFAKARTRFQASRAYRGIAGRTGIVSSLEVTWSVMNGWHPHVHSIVFCDRRAFGEGPPDARGRLSSPAIDMLRASWIRELQRVGLASTADVNDLWAHALDVRDGSEAARYAAGMAAGDPWTLADELTKAHAKIGARSINGLQDHVTPFQLLAWAAAGDHRARVLFRIYADAFAGRRMLTYSPGLKDRLGLADVDDVDLANDDDVPAESRVGSISIQCLGVLWARGAVGELLAWVAEFGGEPDARDRLRQWIERVEGRPRIESGRIAWREEFRGIQFGEVA